MPRIQAVKVEAVAVAFALALPLSVRAFDCPPYQPLTNEKLNVGIKGKIEGLKATILGGSLDAAVAKESQAVYSDTGGDADTKLIKYSMLVMLCQSIRDDSSLDATSRTQELQRVLSPLGFAASLPPGAPTDDFTNQLEGTKWKVGAYDGNGNLSAFDTALLWEFGPNQTVGVRDHWTGTWNRDARNGITIKLEDKTGQTDQFRVDFLSASDFVAFDKDGKRYRQGQKM
jgi:hypothetical protein